MILNLKTEMERNNYTIEKLADVLGIHRNTMMNKLEGKTPLSFEEAQELKEKLFPYADIQYLCKNFPNNTIKSEKNEGA